MLRLVGAGMLLAASAALGLSAAGELTARVRDLEQLILAIKSMEWELHSKRSLLPEVLRRTMSCMTGNVKEFYLLCISRLERKEGVPFSQIWEQAAEAAPLHLNDTDRALLLEVGRILGRSDADSQCIALKETRERLTRALEDAREEKNRMGRVYGMLGITAGSFLAIILI